MTIKYAARGISTQMRTAEELLFTDGVTLKPVNGGDVLIDDDNNSVIIVGTSYNASTGGCTVNGTVYESGDELINSILYIIQSSFSAYDLSTETLVGIGYNDDTNEYITPEITWYSTFSSLVTQAGLYRTDTIPTQTPVWKISDGTVGTRYTGSEGDAVVKDANGAFSYYDSVAECDAVWTTQNPVSTAYSRSAAYQNSNQSLATTGWNAIYAPGESVVLAGDTHKDYVITGMWNAAGGSVYKEGVCLSCYLYNGNQRIRIRNRSSSSISWNRIEYVAYDLFRIYLKIEHTDYTLNPGSQMNNCSNRNGSIEMERSPNETYTVVAAYKADGTPVDAALSVIYNSAFASFGIKNNSGDSKTFAYVDFKVTG